MSFSEKLKDLRLEREITQNDLAKGLLTSENIVRNLEKGRSEPDLDTIRRLTRYFSVSADYLLDLNEDMYLCHNETEMTIPAGLMKVIQIARAFNGQQLLSLQEYAEFLNKK